MTLHECYYENITLYFVIIGLSLKIDHLHFFRLIPVPMVGFKELLRRLKVQDQMTKQHQTRLDVRIELRSLGLGG